MEYINDYTENALKNSGQNIRNYTRKESYGRIIIQYDLIDRTSGAGIGACVGSLGGLGLAVGAAFTPAAPLAIGLSVAGLWGGPVGGAIAGAAIGKSSTKTHYFDVATGELLGSNKDEAASKLNDKGCQLFEEGRYTEATEYFDNAFLSCSSGYHDEKTFRDNRDYAKAEALNAEGNSFHNQKNYAEAIAKYQAAYNQCPASKTDARNKYQNNEASSLNDQGLELWDNGYYTGAAAKFNAAYLKCTSGYSSKQLFVNNRGKAQTEIDAIELNNQGNAEFAAGNYTQAKAQYQAAINKSTVAANKTTYTVGVTKAQNELDAITLKEQGDIELNAGRRYDDARTKYQKAIDKSAVKGEQDKYTESIAYSLWQEGVTYYKQDKHDEAIGKYNEAIQLTKNNSNKTNWEANKNAVIADKEQLEQAINNSLEEFKRIVKEASDLHKEGRIRLENGREIVEDQYANDDDREQANKEFNEALSKFKQAIQHHALQEIATSLKELCSLCEHNRHMDGLKEAKDTIAEYYPDVYQEINRNTQNNSDVADSVVIDTKDIPVETIGNAIQQISDHPES